MLKINMIMYYKQQCTSAELLLVQKNRKNFDNSFLAGRLKMGECKSSHEDHENHLCKLVGDNMQTEYPEQYHKLVKDPQLVCR